MPSFNFYMGCDAMNQKYSKRGFVIFQECNEFIVSNTKKDFKDGHAHVKSFEFGRTLIDWAIKKKLPRNPYLAESLIRISNDKECIEKLQELKESILTHKDFEKLISERSEIDVSKCI